jgi:hypothetical protein
MQGFVHVSASFWAIGYVIHNAVVGDEFARVALACVAAQFQKVLWDFP